MSNQML